MKKQTLIKYYGSQSKLARALSVSPQAVQKWPETIPILQQYRIERITGGKFIAKERKV